MEDNTIVTSAWLDQEDRRVTDCIRTYGCYIQVVYAEDDDPGFAYTVGLFGIGHPELLVFGLDMESISFVLNGLFAQICNGGDLMPGEFVRVPGGDTALFVEVLPNPGEIMYSANRHYQRPAEASVPAYQLTWEMDGLFPWDPGYPDTAVRQPRPGEFGPV